MRIQSVHVRDTLQQATTVSSRADGSGGAERYSTSSCWAAGERFPASDCVNLAFATRYLASTSPWDLEDSGLSSTTRKPVTIAENRPV